MKLEALQTLSTIARNGSFADSAEQLTMTLSALSMQMKTLEQTLDVQLFDRRFRPPQLTPLGRRVAERADEVLARYDDLLTACQPDNQLRGDFRIGFVLTASVRLLPSFLVQTRKRFPDARFDVTTGLSDELVKRVENGGLDAAVVTGAPDLPPTLATVMLTREELVYCVPPRAATWQLSTCMRKLSFIHFLPQTGIGRLIARHLSEAGLRPSDVIVLDSVEAVAECVRAGVGFSILPEPDIRRHAGERIVLRPLDAEPVTRELTLTWLHGSGVDAHTAALAGIFRNCAAQGRSA